MLRNGKVRMRGAGDQGEAPVPSPQPALIALPEAFDAVSTLSSDSVDPPPLYNPVAAEGPWEYEPSITSADGPVEEAARAADGRVGVLHQEFWTSQ